LNDETVKQAIKESFRVLEKGGDFVIKLPNFDDIYEAFIGNSECYEIVQDGWNFEEIIPTWKHKDVEDSIENRALSLITSIVDESARDLFERKTLNHKRGYIGLVLLSKFQRQDLINYKTPKMLADYLVDIACNEQDVSKFNHRNAWSKLEFIKYVTKFGFNLVTSSETEILESCTWIPDLKSMRSISSYFWFRKD
jgi:hypothetical protein